tara:strand:- start:19 stop:885 length:867 start_codon:yes stop_codon:yes gene_type:complete
VNQKSLSCVVIHKGYKPYLKYNLEITSKNNHVYLIGNKEIKFLENLSKNITFIDIEKYENNQKLNYLKENFQNYSTNSFDFEWFCFARVFILKEFLNEYNLDSLFYIDSDNVLLVDVNNLMFEQETAFLVPNNQSKYRMTGSIHSSLISKNYCNEFEILFNDIYINKERFDLIKEKIDFHQKEKIPGGICDMTLHYLIYHEEKLKIHNILEPFKNKDGEMVVFMNHINNGEGPLSMNNYALKNEKIKIYNRNKIFDIILNYKILVCNIHYQGSAKNKINRFTKYFIKY